MRPDGHRELDDLLSGDAGRILSATEEILATHDTRTLDVLTDALDRIGAATIGVDLGGAFVPNRLRLAHALDRLRLYANERANGRSKTNCYCRLFGGYMLASPDYYAKRKRLEVVSKTVLKEEYATVFRCRCTGCGTEFIAREEVGWHLPTYNWAET